MKKPANYDQVEAKRGGEFEKLPAGGYVLKVVNANEMISQKTNRPMLEIILDIAEGEFTDHFKKLNEKLKGNIYLKFYALADEEAAANLKGVIESFVESNRNFDFNFENVKCLCDKKVGANLRYEEYTNNEGAIKESIKIAYLAPIGEIEKMKVLPLKKLNTQKGFNSAVSNLELTRETKNDDLPF